MSYNKPFEQDSPNAKLCVLMSQHHSRSQGPVHLSFGRALFKLDGQFLSRILHFVNKPVHTSQLIFSSEIHFQNIVFPLRVGGNLSKSQHLQSILRNESRYSIQYIRFCVEMCHISSLYALFRVVSMQFLPNYRKIGSSDALHFISPSTILDPFMTTWREIGFA